MKIEIEYIVANALVELYENSNLDYVSFDALHKYGVKIKEILNNNNIQAVLLFSDYYLIRFAHNYSDMFDIQDNKIYKKKNVSCDEIRERIISYMTFDLLKAMINQKSLEVLGIKL